MLAENIKHTNLYKRQLKHKLNLVIKELITAEEKEYDKVENEGEKILTELFNVKYEMIKLLSSFGLEHSANIINMLNAYRENEKEISLCVNKILKHE